MGEMAELALDGTVDPETGEWNFDGEDGPGWPMTGEEAFAFKRDSGLHHMLGHERTELVYLAARYSRHPEMQGVRAALAGLGIEVSSRWIEGGHTVEKEGSTQADDEARQRFAEEDFSDLLMADTIICFTEEPRATTTRGGRHVEFGAAYALGLRTIVVGPRENVFYHMPGVEHVDSLLEALTHLREHPLHPEAEREAARLASLPVHRTKPKKHKPIRVGEPGAGTSKKARQRQRRRAREADGALKADVLG